MCGSGYFGGNKPFLWPRDKETGRFFGLWKIFTSFLQFIMSHQFETFHQINNGKKFAHIQPEFSSRQINFWAITYIPT